MNRMNGMAGWVRIPLKRVLGCDLPVRRHSRHLRRQLVAEGLLQQDPGGPVFDRLTFRHGVHPPELKQLTAHLKIRRLPYPQEILLPSVSTPASRQSRSCARATGSSAGT